MHPSQASTADLATLVREHAGRVRRVLARRGVPASELPDAEQEVFIVAHRKLAAFEGRSSLTTWLLGIAANVASQHRRSARYRRERIGLDAEPACPALDPLARLQAIELVTRVRRLLDGLSPEQREVIVLHELSELSMHEVARELDVPLKTAFSRLYAGHRALRRALVCDAARRVPSARKPHSRVGALVGLALGLRWLPRAQASAAPLQLAAIALVCASLSVPSAAPGPMLLEADAAPARTEQLTRRAALPALFALAAPEEEQAAPFAASAPVVRVRTLRAEPPPLAEPRRDLVMFRAAEADAYARLPYPHPFEERAFSSVDPARTKPRLINQEAFCPAHAPCAP